MGATVETERAAPLAPASVDLHGEDTPARLLARQLWATRSLLAILARKEFHVRYRRASLGILWALGLPLLQALVLAVVFSHVTRIHHAPHYAVFVLSGMAAWVFFSVALSSGATAIVDGTELSSRVYFPRAVLPLVQVASNLYSLAITLAIVVAVCPLFGVGLGPRTLLLVPATVLLVLLTAGLCLVASALHVYFRDMRYVVSAALIVWMYVTPVIYPASDAPRALRAAIDLNPMTGVIDVFHLATVGQAGAVGPALLATAGWTVALLATAAALHCRYDRVFADLL